MVDIEGKVSISEEGTSATYSWPEKRAATFKVTKEPGGFIFFKVSCDKGAIPSALSGRYTSIEKALLAIYKYLLVSPQSVASYANEREKKKEAKDGSKSIAGGGKQVRKGPNN